MTAKKIARLIAGFMAISISLFSVIPAFAEKVESVVDMDEVIDLSVDEGFITEAEDFVLEEPTVFLETVTPKSGDIKDSDDLTDSDISITDVNCTYTKDAEGGKVYHVSLKYTGISESTVQISMLGYVYDVTPNEVPEITGDDAVFAADQAYHGAYNGVIEFVLKEKGVRPLSGDKLVLCVGSDVTQAAQAVLVDLAGAKEEGAEPFIITSVEGGIVCSIPYGFAGDPSEILPSTVAVKGTVGGETDQDGMVDVIWDTASLDLTPTMPATVQTIIGILDVDGEEYQNPDELTASADVTITPLTEATAVQPTAVTVEPGTVDEVKAQIATAVSAVTLQNGEVTDTISIDATDIDLNGIDPTIPGSGTANIVVSGTSENGIFELTTPVNTSVSVTISTGILGDANGDKVVDGLDVLMVQSNVMFNTAITKENLADVNTDGKINGLDAIIILKNVVFGTEF